MSIATQRSKIQDLCTELVEVANEIKTLQEMPLKIDIRMSDGMSDGMNNKNTQRNYSDIFNELDEIQHRLSKKLFRFLIGLVNTRDIDLLHLFVGKTGESLYILLDSWYAYRFINFLGKKLHLQLPEKHASFLELVKRFWESGIGKTVEEYSCCDIDNVHWLTGDLLENEEFELLEYLWKDIHFCVDSYYIDSFV